MKGVRRIYAKEWELMLEEIPGGSQVAEVGCGMGYLMELIKKNGSHPYGYDFSKVAVETTQSRGLSAECVDLRTFKPNGQAYDVVIGSHVLEHMKDDVAFLQICASMLNGSASKVIMSVPSDDRHPISLMEHQHNYTEETLRDTMSAVFANVTIKPVTKERFGEEIKPAFVAIGSEPHGI
jgi:2-polyprenyl-3-methyl-5-hydroxy-6-metoxy-1,4-benzoquinol methylase